MDLGLYVKQLLLEHDTVIVPTLGTFTSEYRHADLNEVTGEINPPSQKILFNQKIKNNDGLLACYIAGCETISQSDALKKIQKECEEILFKLDKGEKVKFEKLGVLYCDERKENILFEQIEEDGVLLEAFGLEKTTLEIDNDEEIVYNDIGVEKIEDKQDLGEKVEKSIDYQFKYDENEKSDNSIELNLKSEEFEVNDNDKEDDFIPKGKKKGIVGIGIFILILIVGGVIFFINSNFGISNDDADLICLTDENEECDSLSLVMKNDSLILDSLKVNRLLNDSILNVEKDISGQSDDELLKMAVDTEYYVTPDPDKFYLVGGSFKEPKNAEKYLKNLQNVGYKPFHLGKRGNFYIVGIEVFNSEREAFAAQYDFLDIYPDSGVWVYRVDE